MKKLQQSVELTANIAIVIVAILLGIGLVQKYIFNKPAASPPLPSHPTVGSTVNLNVDWDKHPRTLILALQTQCRFCGESAPFYKRVIEIARNSNTHLVAVLPTSKEESVRHLEKLGLTSLDVRQASLDTLEVSGTPTLILTNSKGEITNFWLGKLTPDKELEVIDQLR